AERGVVLGVAQPLQDHLLGGGRGDPAEAGGGVVELAGLLALFEVLGVLLRPHGHVSGLPVELHARVAAASLGAVVRDEEGRLDRLDHQVEGDLLLPNQAPQGAHVDVHGYASSSSFMSFLSLRLNSTCTRALAISGKPSLRAVALRPFTPGTSTSRPSSS